MLTFKRINRNIRSIRRYRTILGILIKYGFGHVVEQLNINYYVELGRRFVTLGKAPREIERLSVPERLRLAMEELGPSFVKLGQIISTRPDLIPREYTDEFRKLQDDVPPEKFEAIQDVIKKEFGLTPDELFATFDPEPLAAASIAQVHRATLESGEEVVVKIRRPKIEVVLETDLDILTGLAYLVENHIETEMIADPLAIVREFRRVINRELDFSREGHTIDRFRENFREDKTFSVPNVYWKFTGHTVLTMDYLEGVKVSEIKQLETAGYDPSVIAKRGADVFLKQVLEYGLFHGDPHPGNVFILPENRIAMLDFGMVGHLDDTLKYQLVDLLVSLTERDVDHIMHQLLFSGEIADETDRRQLKRELSEFIDENYEIPLRMLKAGRLLTEFVEILQRHRIKFPPDLILLGKALVTMEGIGRQLDPEFNMIAHLKPFVERMLRERMAPGNVTKEAIRTSHSYFKLFRTLPGDIKEFINRINRNRFKVTLEHKGLDKLISDLDRSSNRISFSMLVGSIIIGSSLVILTDKGPQLFGFPVLGLLGYSIAGILGLWLAIGILRSGRL